jgi:hypothetical protein
MKYPEDGHCRSLGAVRSGRVEIALHDSPDTFGMCLTTKGCADKRRNLQFPIAKIRLGLLFVGRRGA